MFKFKIKISKENIVSLEEYVKSKTMHSDFKVSDKPDLYGNYECSCYNNVTNIFNVGKAVAEFEQLLKEKEMASFASEAKYVWLDVSEGEFSNSWNRDLHNFCFPDGIKEISLKPGARLIQYRCLNDSEFEFYNAMKLNKVKM